MSDFYRPVRRVVTTAMSGSGPAASPNVLSNQLRGRHAITICATATTYVGGSDVSSTNGIKLDAGEKMTFPVVSEISDCIYADGKYTLAEYF